MFAAAIRVLFYVQILRKTHTTFASDGDLLLDANNHTQVLPPSQIDDGPIKVYVGFHAESMGNLKPSDMAFDLDMYLRLSWQDKRLAHNDSDLKVITDLILLSKMWLPDLYFANARSASFQHVTVPNFAVYIQSDGTVALSRRITMTVACNMNLKRYPLDNQECFVKIMSYAHTESQMSVRWFTDEAVSFNEKIDLPELRVIDISPLNCSSEYPYAKMEHRGSKKARFSCLEARIRLSRSATYHLVQSYIPTFLIVLISWISFWIDCNAVPARISLSFTTLLTLSTMGAGLRYSLPPVSYAKAIDYWFGVCMLFVFGALLEFAVVNNFMRRSQKCAKLAEAGRTGGKTDSFMTRVAEFNKMQGTTDDKEPETRFGEDGSENKNGGGTVHMVVAMREAVNPLLTRAADRKSEANGSEELSDAVEKSEFVRLLTRIQTHADDYAKKGLRVDLICRVGFPVSFFLFATFYWVFYLLT